MSSKSQETTSYILLNPISFAAKRLPNFKEAILSAFFQSAVSVFAGRVKAYFGKNSMAPSIFRDASKTPTIVTNVFNKNQLGYTDVDYDEGAICTNLIKISCKSIILVPSYFLVSQKTFGYVARGGNYICEMQSRFLNIATKERQKQKKANNKDIKKEHLECNSNCTQKHGSLEVVYDTVKKMIEYLEYVYNNAQKSWLLEAFAETLVKVTIADQLSEVIKNVGYKDIILEKATVIENGIHNQKFSLNHDIYSKFYVITKDVSNNFESLLKAFGSFSSILVVDWSANFVNEFMDAYLLGTPTRTLQDSVGILAREFNEINKTQAFNHYFEGNITVTSLSIVVNSSEEL